MYRKEIVLNIIIFGCYTTFEFEEEPISFYNFQRTCRFSFLSTFQPAWSPLRATGTFGMLRKLNHKLKFICFAGGNERVAASVMRRRVKRMIKRVVDRIRWELNWISSVLSRTIRFYVGEKCLTMEGLFPCANLKCFVAQAIAMMKHVYGVFTCFQYNKCNKRGININLFIYHKYNVIFNKTRDSSSSNSRKLLSNFIIFYVNKRF